VADKDFKKKSVKREPDTEIKAKKTATKKTAVKRTVSKKAEVEKPAKEKKVKKTASVIEKMPAYEPSISVKEKVIKKTAIRKIKDLTAHTMEDATEETEIEASKFIKAEAKDTEVEVKPVKPQERHETTIPDKYADDKIVLMTRDPNWCYVYWDLSLGLMESKAKNINEKYDLVLRVYDITDVDFNGSNSHKFIDIKVNGEAGNWYINVWEAGRSYIVDIGYKTLSGKFILLARSNAVLAPSDDISGHTDEEWMIVDEDFEELFRLSGGGRAGIGGSEGLRSRLQSDLSSGSVSSFSSPAGGTPAKKRGFFLNADTELILYGNTESDASLTVKGEKVELRPDGSFSLRFNLPNGTIELPVEAVSSDKVDRISIKISVERKTQ
jgi:uncharacterized protein